MGIFSRLGEIINANISNMLEQSENPEKMIRLMIHEMEDTLTEIKSSAAEVIAERIRIERTLGQIRAKETEWEERAALAISKDRDDLAREALERKLLYASQAEEVSEKLDEAEGLVKSYHEDIAHLETQLEKGHRRQREILNGLKRVQQRKQVEDKLYQFSSSGAFALFEDYNQRLDHLEAEVEVNQGRGKTSLERQFEELEQSSDVDTELERLKKKVKS